MTASQRTFCMADPSLVAPYEGGRWTTRLTNTMSSSSAPAARACAPPSRLSASGVSVGLVCKSLLGKAHTVMAEGGIAAALANVDDRDNWKVHFADTMRGGQYVNNWRMAQLHAQEAPARVRELEAWGAVFDRTQGRQHPAAQLRRAQVPAPGARRRPHRPRTHPHAAGPRHPPGHRGLHGAHGHPAAEGRRPHRRCARPTTASAAGSTVFKAKAIVLATGGIGKAYKITSNSWEYTGDGHTLAYDAGAELIDMEFVQFHPTGMVWPPSVRGILVTEGVRGEGGVLRNNKGERFMFGDIPDNYKPQTAKDEEEGFRYVLGDKNANRAAGTADARPRRPLHRPRGEGGPRQPARRRLPRTANLRRVVRQAAERLQGRGALEEEAAEHVPPVQGTRRARHHEGGDGGRPDDALRHGRRARRCDTQMSRIPGLFACGECAAGINGANRLGGNSLSDLLVLGKRAGEFAAQVRARTTRAGQDSRRSGRGRGEVGAGAVRPRRRRRARSRCSKTLQDMMQDLVGIVRKEDEMQRALDGLEKLRDRAAQGAGRPATASTTPAGTPRWTCTAC